MNLPDIVASDAELVKGDGVPVLDGHFDGLEMRVHGHVHAGDCPVNLKKQPPLYLHIKLKAGLPEPPIFEISGSGSGSYPYPYPYPYP